MKEKTSKEEQNSREEGQNYNRWVGCPIEAEYFGEERKKGKEDRKIASARDRSKYKKTDKKQQEKQPQEVPKEGLQRGRVLSISSQGIVVDADGGEIICSLRGSLKKEKSHAKNLVTVGDFVLFDRAAGGEGLIARIEPRFSTLSRAENLSRKKEQLIAANIDQVIITVSVVSPSLKPFLIDRYIIAAQKGGMSPIIVVNKIDLLQSREVDSAILLQDQEIFAELLKAYEAIGIPIVGVSTVTGEGMSAMKALMTGKASVFSGQSGVGKSSLINCLIGQAALRVGGLVEKTNKGTHTTSSALLLPLDFGGFCIDTPGIKSFGVWDLDKEEVEQYFPEIFNCGHACRYHDCSHFHEEGCSVIKAVENGEISRLRYASYLSLLDSASQEHFRR